jgi:hypothetical protein
LPKLKRYYDLFFHNHLSKVFKKNKPRRVSISIVHGHEKDKQDKRTWCKSNNLYHKCVNQGNTPKFKMSTKISDLYKEQSHEQKLKLQINLQDINRKIVKVKNKITISMMMVISKYIGLGSISWLILPK